MRLPGTAREDSDNGMARARCGHLDAAPPGAASVIARALAVLLLAGCSAPTTPPPSPAREPTPAPAAPAPTVATSPLPDAGESEEERRARLARELEKLDENPTQSVGPNAEGLLRQFIEAVNARDKSGVIATSSPECLSGACADLAREAARKFVLQQTGSVSVRGSRATAGADVVCDGRRKCDFVYLLLERRVVTVQNQGLLSSAWAWRVANVTEDQGQTQAWLDAAQTPAPETPSSEPVKVTTPSGEVTIGSLHGGGVANAASVIARMRPGFRRCYARGLAEDPDASGKVQLELRIGPQGEVVTATAKANGNFPASVAACMEARARAARFDPPQGGAAKIVIPFVFTRK
jgi:hypothetical protein